MRSAHLSVILLLATPLLAQTGNGKCPAVAEGIVLHASGAWKPPLQILQRVRVDRVQLTGGSGELSILLSDRYLHKVCSSEKSCVVECPPLQGDAAKAPAKQLSANASGALRSLEARPAFRDAMSRAAGWLDSVIGYDTDGTADLAPVFRATRRGRTLEFRICTLERAECSEVFQVIWDEQHALIKFPGLKDQVYLVTAKDGANEAWVRFTPMAKAAALRKEYEDALDALDTWGTPPGADSRAILGRVERMILAGLGGGH